MVSMVNLELAYIILGIMALIVLVGIGFFWLINSVLNAWTPEKPGESTDYEHLKNC